MTKTLKATPETVHWGYFSKSLAPALKVADGDTVEVETFSYPRGENFPELLTPELQVILDKVTDIGPGPHLLTGPIHVEGAQPGDVLAIEIEEVEPILEHAYNRIQPGKAGLGLLPEDFPEGRLTLLKLDRQAREVVLSEKIRVPMRCFFGIMGVAPAEEERWTSRVPAEFGGNIDITELVAGSTLYLPVFQPGGLLSVGDGHSAQGDGEVDLSASETSLRGRLKLSVRRDFKLQRPMVETKTHIITTGFDEDLDEAVKIATRDMIDWLVVQHGMERLDAYLLCTLALDLRISQVVNLRKGVHAMLSKAIFR